MEGSNDDEIREQIQQITKDLAKAESDIHSLKNHAKLIPKLMELARENMEAAEETPIQSDTSNADIPKLMELTRENTESIKKIKESFNEMTGKILKPLLTDMDETLNTLVEKTNMHNSLIRQIHEITPQILTLLKDNTTEIQNLEKRVTILERERR